MFNASSPATRKPGLLGRLWQIPPRRGLVAIAVLGLVVLAFYFGVFAYRSHELNTLAGGDVAIPDIQSDGYDIEWFFHFATGLRPQARDYYIRTQWQFDTVFPFVYGMLFAFAIALPWEHFRRKHALADPPRYILGLWIFPLLAVAFDLAENVTVISLLENMPTGCVPPQSWFDGAERAGRYTLLKWRFCLLSLIVVVLGCVCAAVTRRGGKS